MASKNEFLSNYHEWDFKLLKCDVLCGPFGCASGFIRQRKNPAESENRKRFNIDHLNISNIYYEHRGSGEKGNGSIHFLLFSDAESIAGVEIFAQMCKKLNRFRGGLAVG
jgi:hypothetical protein